ncbi:hypothetical protein B0H16DRAFT_1572522, partial [Mycena metata]
MFLLQPLRVLTSRLPLFTSLSAARRAPSSHAHSTLPDPESKPNRRISTFNSALIQSEDFLDLSGQRLPRIGFTHMPAGANPQIHYLGVSTRFPDNCTGFLYYHRESSAAPLEGGIRFRQTTNNQPSSFSGGHDLLLPSGAPWEILLPQLTRTYHRFGDELLREKLVTSGQFALCRRVFATMGRIQPPSIIFRLTQQFPVNFGAKLRFTIVGPDALHIAEWQFGMHRFPFTGSAIARFEPSMSTKDGHRVVYLRIIKISKPAVFTVDQSNARYAPPQDGQLLMRRFPGGDQAPWEFDLDGSFSAATALRALWESQM